MVFDTLMTSFEILIIIFISILYSFWYPKLKKKCDVHRIEAMYTAYLYHKPENVGGSYLKHNYLFISIWLVYILMQFTYNYMYSVLRFSFILVMCLVPNVECLSVLSILDCPFGFLWWNNSVLCSNTTSTHLYLAIDSLCKDQ